MKQRRYLYAIVAAVLVSAAVLWGAHEVLQSSQPKLASLMPDGALLYVESPDFQSILKDWANSPEKQEWLKSNTYAVFGESRLFGRLQSAQQEFETAAGVPPDMDFLSQIAGKQSAFAWYDIGELQFLYLSKLPSASIESSGLWQTRGKFARRQVGDAEFYVRTDPESKRVVAFASYKGWLVLGTREDLVANTLSSMTGEKRRTIQDESWYSDAVAQAKESGDLRMVLNLEKIVVTPHFRSYWIQQNITATKQFRSAISDLYRTKDKYREERVLLPSTANTELASAVGDISELTAAVPADAGFYKAIASPSTSAVVGILKDKLLDPRSTEESSSTAAPTVSLAEERVGSSSDYETKIDEKPAVEAASDPWAPLVRTLERSKLNGILQVESSVAQGNGIFIGFHSAVVLVSSQDWDAQRVKESISSSLEHDMSSSKLGLKWVDNDGYSQLDGLHPLLVTAKGRYLVLGNDRSLLSSVASRLTEKAQPAQPTIYSAGFSHLKERPNFVRLVTLIDGANLQDHATPAEGEQASPENSEQTESQDQAANTEEKQGEKKEQTTTNPAFFSGNMASLSKMFSRVESIAIVTKKRGENLTQTVTYQWK